MYFLGGMPPPAQPRPQSTPSYDSMEFQDIDTHIGDGAVISSTFIEAVSQSMGFSSLDVLRLRLEGP
jgi:hypothetical protein